MSSTPRVIRRPASIADLLALPPEVAAEVVSGALVEKAAPTFEHGAAQAQIAAQLRGAFGGPPRDGGGGWWIAAELDVQYGEELFRHDLAGWRRGDAPKPVGRPVLRRPDWVCEILSPSNASTDTVRKLRTLHASSVMHYWLADPERRTLTVLRWQPAGYLTLLTAEAGDVIRAEPFDSVELRTAPIFGDD